MWVRFFILYTITMTRYGQGLNFNKSLAIQDYHILKGLVVLPDLKPLRMSVLTPLIATQTSRKIVILISYNGKR